MEIKNFKILVKILALLLVTTNIKCTCGQDFNVVPCGGFNTFKLDAFTGDSRGECVDIPCQDPRLKSFASSIRGFRIIHEQDYFKCIDRQDVTFQQ